MRSGFARRARPATPASPRSTRSCCSFPSSRSPKTSSSAMRRKTGWRRARLAGDAEAGARAARFARQPRSRRRRQGRQPVGRQPPARRDRQGAVAECPRPDHGRADGGAGRSRRAAADGGRPRLRERGVGIVYVSHRMPEIFELADRVTVLRDGAYVGTRPIGEVDEATLVSMMVGRAIDRLFPEAEVPIGDVGPRAAAMSPTADKVRDVSLHAQARRDPRPCRAGRLGPHRAGADDLRHHAGDLGRDPARRQAGHASRSPQQARDLGIAYVPEDRGLQGLIKTQTIRENVSLAILDALSPGSSSSIAAAEARRARDAITRFGIRARGPEQIVRQLSGGNQQKVVLAKWLATEPAHPHHGRADARHRCRRQGRDPSP